MEVIYAQTIANSFLYRHEKLSVVEITPIRYVKLGITLRIKVRGLFLVDWGPFLASPDNSPGKLSPFTLKIEVSIVLHDIVV